MFTGRPVSSGHTAGAGARGDDVFSLKNQFGSRTWNRTHYLLINKHQKENSDLSDPSLCSSWKWSWVPPARRRRTAGPARENPRGSQTGPFLARWKKCLGPRRKPQRRGSCFLILTSVNNDFKKASFSLDLEKNPIQVIVLKLEMTLFTFVGF